MSDVNWPLAMQLLLAQNKRTAGYLARQEIERILEPLRKDKTRLEPFGFKVYSQSDEDGILEEIFRRLGIECGNFVEIGVENGLECNSLWLLHKGWKGAWVEGNPNQKAAIEAKFQSLLQTGKLRLMTSFVTRENFNSIFEQLHYMDETLDFLSIDIDGNDIYLLEVLNIRPKVICIEYNAKWPSPAIVQQAYNPDHRWDGTDYAGSNLEAINRIAKRQGYQLVGTNITGCNAFFVRNDLIQEGKWPKPIPKELENPARYWLFLDHYSSIGHPASFGNFASIR